MVVFSCRMGEIVVRFQMGMSAPKSSRNPKTIESRDCRKRQAEKAFMKKNEKHVTEQIRQPEEKKKGKKGGAAKWVALGIVLLILVATAALGLSYENETGLFSQKLETSFFHLYSPKVPTGKTIRLVTLSDLHISGMKSVCRTRKNGKTFSKTSWRWACTDSVRSSSAARTT